jgi:hypothetical protein
LRERDGEEETGQDLYAGLGDAQLLEQLVEVAGEPILVGLLLGRGREARGLLCAQRPTAFSSSALVIVDRPSTPFFLASL